ncbi:MAG: radical SAM protein [Tractidigestivibacter sp.]|jgi:wyosine [tRNA(Phe)-imidazoG37] synthetase (radical SAM superfamily)|uniref:radical SAM protein n=1 Tax=Tractidigestivibacter sp. TaxID=2847320 RepID=UPI003D8C2A4B
MSTFLQKSPIFGPVLSRRFGVSLGVNLMPASGKICTFDCLYCEDGLNAERRTRDTYVTMDVLAPALERALSGIAERKEALDEVCLAGNGEPTASPIFPQAVDLCRTLIDRYVPSAKLAVLSNGTMASRPEVHDALMRVDRNVLKLDTVDPDYIALLDRPQVPYDVHKQVEAFASFGGHVIIQTIFVRGSYQGASLDNTDEAHVSAWLDAVEKIAPEAVTVYTIARDTPVSGIEKAPREVLDAIANRVRALGIPCSASY